MASGQLANLLQYFRHLVGNQVAPQTDGDLLARFVRDHDQSAFTALVERHGPMVLGVCRRVLHDEHDAEDVFQAVFLVLARKASSLKQYGSLGNWLHTVAYHLAFKAQAGGTKRRAVERQVTDMPEAVAPEATAWAELRPVLDAELNRLPVKYRSAVVLCYLEGKTNEEVARELGWPVGTVKSRLAHARDILRNRLMRRGLSAAPALLAPTLGKQASAAVPAVLLLSTTEAAALFAAGNNTATSIVAVRAVGIAQGVLRAMLISKLKAFAAICLVLGLVGIGSGVLLSQDAKLCPVGAGQEKHPPQAPPAITLVLDGKRDAAAAPDPVPPPAPAKPRGGVTRQLAQLVTLEIPPNTTLEDALNQISEKTKVPFMVNSLAFEAIGVPKVNEQPIQLPKMTNVRLSYALEQLLKSIKGDVYTGTFQVRGGQVEITTTYNLFAEAGPQPVEHPALRQQDPDGMAPQEVWTDPTRRMTKVIAVDIDKRPLAEAVREIAEEAGYQVAIDPRLADKAKTPVSLALERVLFDTAITLLLDATDFDWVWLDNIVYITNKENAQARRTQQKAREAERIRMLREAAEMRGEGAFQKQKVAETSTINVEANKEPLAQVLQGISQNSGIRVVIDPRVSDKAAAVVTTNIQGVPAETAVRLLANMADLQAVRVDQVIYVTSKDNARTFSETQSKLKP